jgi:hypothetical protein
MGKEESETETETFLLIAYFGLENHGHGNLLTYEFLLLIPRILRRKFGLIGIYGWVAEALDGFSQSLGWDMFLVLMSLVNEVC